MTLLAAEGLKKAYGGVQAVAGVSFTVATGEMVALIGPNGAGKSTCFNLLNGQVRPDAGRVILDGVDIAGWRPERVWRMGVGRGFQVAATFGSMTARENLQTALMARHGAVWRFWGRAHRLFVAEADALLARVGLTERADMACATMAYGELKRLELALALVNEPRLLLMDEPAAGMETGDRPGLMELVRRMARDNGCAVLFTEHDMDVVFSVADRILVMDRGELIAQGPPAVIKADRRVREAYLGMEEGGT
jgi:branched-chain amino acid transport system ATP-binding protein